ncbi:MAG TPA: SDR family oxidoreductase [Terrimicrobiaceae bacterium]|nr:SDR family oxidoreductase [Terrimicrobiaceae bacterium]
MNLELEDKVILITGGAKGIGEGITRAFAAEGAIACILGRNPAEAESIVREESSRGRRVESYPVDMTDEDSIQSAVQAIASRHGRIDVVVNNAGGNDAIGLRHSPAEFRESLNKNIVSCFVLAHHTLDHLIASRGNIVNIGSKCSVTGQGGTSGYAASKGAMNALTREWALDLGRHDIRVNCVIPAEVITPLYERWLEQAPDPAAAREQLNQTIPLGRRTTTIREIADAVVFIASPRSSHTTGQFLFVDGGYVHLDRACTQPTTHLKQS